MATQKQIAANPRNALKQAGPRTGRDKAFRRLNPTPSHYPPSASARIVV
jgi:hypothetical protein